MPLAINLSTAKAASQMLAWPVGRLRTSDRSIGWRADRALAAGDQSKSMPVGRGTNSSR